MTILIRNPNFLILDEPTNDLDIATLQTLEEFLENFGGCVLIVSHDRYFMDKLVDHVFAFEGDGVIKDFPGSYSEYREWKEEGQEILIKPKDSMDSVSADKSTAFTEKNIQQKKLSFKERYELEQLEKEITRLEVEKNNLEKVMSTESDHEKLSVLSVKFAEVSGLIEAKTFRWMELSE